MGRGRVMVGVRIRGGDEGEGERAGEGDAGSACAYMAV